MNLIQDDILECQQQKIKDLEKRLIRQRIFKKEALKELEILEGIKNEEQKSSQYQEIKKDFYKKKLKYSTSKKTSN
jgi:hypothetical protein